MAFKFYKTEKVEDAEGKVLEVLPVTVDDMDDVLEVIDLQKELEKMKSKTKKVDQTKLVKMQMKRFYPAVMEIAQRCVKRVEPKNRNKNIEELQEVPNIPMSFPSAMIIALRAIESGMGSEDDIKNLMPQEEQTEKF